MKYVILRDDDVFELNGRFLSLFNGMSVPVNYAVIPGRINNQTVSFLNSRSGFDVVQHGYMHMDHENKSEFCTSQDKQRKDIIKGRLLMKRLNACVDVFVPPFHGYNTDTINILNEQKYAAFASRLNSWHPHGLFSGTTFPVHVCMDDYLSNRMRSGAEFAAITLNALKRRRLVQAVIHHETADSEEVKKFIKIIQKRAKFIRFSDLIKKRTNIKDITFEITNACNLKCKMCGIWKETPKYFLEPEQILTFLDRFDSVNHISITGGECTLHPEFKEIINIIKHKTSNVSVVSNGFNSIEPVKGITYDISIDGLETNHEYQRGVKNSFEKSMRTIKELSKTNKVIVKMTINSKNYKDIMPLFKICKRLGVAFLPKLIENNLGTYYQREKCEDPIFDTDKVMHEIKETLRRINLELRDERIDTIINGKNTGCFTPYKSLFVTCQGKVYPCLYQDPIGTINKFSLYNAAHTKMCINAINGKCPGCFAYHGFLKGFKY